MGARRHPRRGIPGLARTGEVLALLRRGEAVTKSDLAASMGVARSTVNERLELLLRQGLSATLSRPVGRVAPIRAPILATGRAPSSVTPKRPSLSTGRRS